MKYSCRAGKQGLSRLELIQQDGCLDESVECLVGRSMRHSSNQAHTRDTLVNYLSSSNLRLLMILIIDVPPLHVMLSDRGVTQG